MADKVKKRTARRFYDYNLLAVVIILICFGLVMLYSASSYESTSLFGDDMYYLKRQALISVGAVVLALIVSRFDYAIFLKVSIPIYLLSLALMAMVRFTPLGVTVFGARRWLNIMGLQFQPSEIAKIAVIILLARMIVSLGSEFYRFSGVVKVLAVGGAAAFATYFFTDNLSTALIIMGISVFMVFIAHPKTRIFVILFIILVVAGIALVLFLDNIASSSSSFRLRRIQVWRNPEKYSASGGYQVLQGLYAIGSGGFFGKGLGNSTQKLATIPEAQNDMIFTIICEELGIFGAIIVLLLFAYLIYRLFWIAQNAPNLQGTLIASGVMIHISLQVILNICVVLNVIPTTGVTLPFVSYGGTSVFFLMIEIGMALSVSGQIDNPSRRELQKAVRMRTMNTPGTTRTSRTPRTEGRRD